MKTLARILRSSPPARTPAAAGIAIGGLSLCCALSLLGCDRGAPRDGEGPESPAASGREERTAEEGHSDEIHLSPEAIAGNGVRIGVASRRRLVPTIRVPAQVAFNQEGMAHVGSPLRGRASEIRVGLGAEVQKGDVLLILESPELGEAQSDYLQKRTALETAGPGVELARNAYERGKTLFDEIQGVPLAEVQKRESELRAAQARLQEARTAKETAENRLHLLGMDPAAVDALVETREIDPRFVVRAPISGQVIEREVTLGELVGPDREALLVLADMNRLWVLADVPETKMGDIAVGTPARVLMGASGDHWCEGVVSFLSPAIDPATRTIQARIEATDRHPDLRPGTFAQAEIQAVRGSEAGGEDVIAIPEIAVQTVEGEPSVFVPGEGEPGVFRRRRVLVGRSVGGFVPVFSGLAAGDAYVEAGSFILKAELGKSGAEHGH